MSHTDARYRFEEISPPSTWGMLLGRREIRRPTLPSSGKGSLLHSTSSTLFEEGSEVTIFLCESLSVLSTVSVSVWQVQVQQPFASPEAQSRYGQHLELKLLGHSGGGADGRAEGGAGDQEDTQGGFYQTKPEIVMKVCPVLFFYFFVCNFFTKSCNQQTNRLTTGQLDIYSCSRQLTNFLELQN